MLHTLQLRAFVPTTRREARKRRDLDGTAEARNDVAWIECTLEGMKHQQATPATCFHRRVCTMAVKSDEPASWTEREPKQP